MKKINYKFREELNKILGGFAHNYCYQCGACVGDCPAHRFHSDFNPRNLMLQTIYGLEEDLIGENTQIWNCTNCYNCYERCPQDVHPIEVIIALKNMSIQKGYKHPAVQNILDRVKETGVTVLTTELIKRRRSELGLPDFNTECQKEVKEILES